MGHSSSKLLVVPIEDVSADAIADYVLTLGASFAPYEAQLRTSGMSGTELQDLDEDCLNVVLDSLRITNRLHRRKLLSVCRKQLQQRQRPQPHQQHYQDSFSGQSLSLQAALDMDNQSVVSQYSVGSKSTKTPPPSLLTISPKRPSADGSTTPPPPPPPPQAGLMENMCVGNAAEALGLLVHMENQKRLLRQEDRPSGPPTETAVICLTDVQGSTALWEADPVAMRHALNVHDELIRDLRAQFGGYEIDTEGDAFFLAFHTAADALEFAGQLQRQLRDADWDDAILVHPEAAATPEHRGLRVRMGLHGGPVATTHNAVTGRLEYTGPTLERAKQVEGLAEGGQILVTEPTWEAASKTNNMSVQIVPTETTGVVRVLCGPRQQPQPQPRRGSSSGSLASHISKHGSTAARSSRRRSMRSGGSFSSVGSLCSMDSDGSGSKRSSMASVTSKRRRGRKPSRSKSMEVRKSSTHLTAQERLSAMT